MSTNNITSSKIKPDLGALQDVQNDLMTQSLLVDIGCHSKRELRAKTTNGSSIYTG